MVRRGCSAAREAGEDIDDREHPELVTSRPLIVDEVHCVDRVAGRRLARSLALTRHGRFIAECRPNFAIDTTGACSGGGTSLHAGARAERGESVSQPGAPARVVSCSFHRQRTHEPAFGPKRVQATIETIGPTRRALE